ncbi:MAG: acyl-CoA dehydrogenase, partial [Proteobacteria bacterium]|nr:acyl-CoA dehydrogenase [Pseudomonadota bacterium]
ATSKDENSNTALPTAFLVRRETSGLKVSAPSKKMGLDGAEVAEVYFNDCFIPDNALLGEVGQGLQITYNILNKGRLRIAALSVGIAARLIQESLAYSLTRHQFNRPIANFQLIRAMLADCQAEYFAAQCMVREAAKLLETNSELTGTIASCKLFCTEMVCRVADRAVQIHGGQGYLAARGIEGFYRDVRLFRIYEGTNQIQQLIISKEMINRHKERNHEQQHPLPTGRVNP